MPPKKDILTVMRAPKRRRPLRRVMCVPPEGSDVSALAASARYVGSSEHKSYPSFAGPARLRADASKCDPSLNNQHEPTSWLRDAIMAGQCGAPWDPYPKYVWCKHNGIVYEGRLVNPALGEYKGYPLRLEEWPERFRE